MLSKKYFSISPTVLLDSDLGCRPCPTRGEEIGESAPAGLVGIHHSH